MTGSRHIRGLSAQSAKFLVEGESEHADFKRNPESISADDLVAFANTAFGGSILVGVDEGKGASGTQIGLVIGCDVGDAAILQIANKALSCIPPIAIEVFVENIDKRPFLRIDVPSSPTKPHCTPKGIYCRRDGSRNRPLHPGELLKIFLENESRIFAERFESAANRVSEQLTSLEKALDGSIKKMADQLGWAEFKLDDTEDTLHVVQTLAQHLNVEIKDLTTRLRTIFRQDKRQDPIYDRERKNFLEKIVDELLKNEKLLNRIKEGNTIQLRADGKAAEELAQDDLEPIFREAVKIATDRAEQAKYSVEVKKPAEYESVELQDMEKLVTEGGEVADGIEHRLRTAAALGVVRYNKIPVGVGGLKKPAANYRSFVFKKACASYVPSDFPFELGWIFLKEQHRRKGKITQLIDALLKVAGANGVFATARVSNDKMQRILDRQMFVRHGDAFPSAQNPGEEIALFVRPATKRTTHASRKPKPA